MNGKMNGNGVEYSKNRNFRKLDYRSNQNKNTQFTFIDANKDNMEIEIKLPCSMGEIPDSITKLLEIHQAKVTVN